MEINLRRTSRHGFTTCTTNDPITQENCQFNPHKDRADGRRNCFCFRDMGYEVWICNGLTGECKIDGGADE